MRFFLCCPAVTKGLKKVTNLFQIDLFPHKKVKFAIWWHVLLSLGKNMPKIISTGLNIKPKAHFKVLVYFPSVIVMPLSQIAKIKLASQIRYTD